MQLKTYIVNLKDSVERRLQVQREVSSYPLLDVEFIEAVYGKALCEAEVERMFDMRKFRKRYHREPSPGEIGCTLSHRKCYHHFLSTAEPYVLILEDDVSFVSPKDTEGVLQEGMQLLEKGIADLVLLTSHICYYTKPIPLQGGYNAYKVQNACETCAYLLNRKAAHILLQQQRPWICADDYEQMKNWGIREVVILPHIAIGLSCTKKVDSVIETPVYRPLSLKQRIYNKCVYTIRCVATKQGWIVNQMGF